MSHPFIYVVLDMVESLVDRVCHEQNYLVSSEMLSTPLTQDLSDELDYIERQLKAIDTVSDLKDFSSFFCERTAGYEAPARFWLSASRMIEDSLHRCRA